MNTKNPVSNAKSQLISIRFPHELVARMKAHTEYSGQTMTQLVHQAVEYYLDNRTPMEDLDIIDDIDEDEEEPVPRWGAGRAITQRGLHREGGREC